MGGWRVHNVFSVSDDILPTKIFSSHEDKPPVLRGWFIMGHFLPCGRFVFLKLGFCWCILGSPENGSCKGPKFIGCTPAPSVTASGSGGCLPLGEGIVRRQRSVNQEAVLTRRPAGSSRRMGSKFLLFVRCPAPAFCYSSLKSTKTTPLSSSLRSSEPLDEGQRPEAGGECRVYSQTRGAEPRLCHLQGV